MFDQEMALELTEFLDATETSSRFDDRLKKQGSKLQKLADEAQRRGFKPAKGPKAELGIRQKFRAKEPVKPPKGTQAQPVQELEFELMLREMTKDQSEDQVAIATVIVRAGTNIEEYDMLLEAPSGNFAQAREFKVTGNKVVKANSWWTAARSCLTSKCSGVCVGALLTCSGTWVAYLGCVALACGGCWARCAACASCNCRWWCKWAAGCCRQ